MILIVIKKQNRRNFKQKNSLKFSNFNWYFNRLVVIKRSKTNQRVNCVFIINDFNKFFEKINDNTFSNNVKKITSRKRFLINMKICFYNLKQFQNDVVCNVKKNKTFVETHIFIFRRFVHELLFRNNSLF